MRRKITVIGSDEVGAVVAPLLAELDIADVTVVSPGEWEELGGSDVVVIPTTGDDLGREVAMRSPDAVVVVASASAAADCATLLDQTCFPRTRVVGVASADAAPQARADAAALLVQAVLHDRPGAVECLVRGEDEVFAPAMAELGTEGVRRISAPEAP